MKYKGCYIVYILDKSGEKKIPYFSEFKVSENDLVIVEDNEEPVRVIQSNIILNFSDESKLSELKKVIRIHNANDTEKDDTLGLEIKNIANIATITEVNKVFSYAEYHADCLMKSKDLTYVTDYSLFKLLMLVNHTKKDYENVKISFKFSHQAFSLDDVYLNNIEANCELKLRIPYLKVDQLAISTIKEQLAVQVRITLTDEKVKSVLSTEERLFTVYPLSQPSSLVVKDYRLLAKYITPNVSSVKQITLNAVKYNKKALIGYQNKHYEDLINEAKSIYLALHSHGIVYQNPPSSNNYFQRLRMPEEVLLDKKGTCLDLALLYCACLEEVGINSILVVLDNHAFAGFFLDRNANFPNGEEFSPTNILNYASSKDKSLVLVECTSFSAKSPTTFKEALAIGIKNLKGYNGEFSAIDIKSCHRGIFSPLPVEGESFDLDSSFSSKTYGDEDDDLIIEHKYVDQLVVEEEIDRFTLWERKLLDLTEANPLVNINLKISNSLRLISRNEITDILKEKDNVPFECPKWEEININRDQVEHYFKQQEVLIADIYANYGNDKILSIGYEKTLKDLIKKSNSAMEETGAATLYLCLGLLKYKRKSRGQIGNAPFMVLPIKLIREKFSSTYHMAYDYDNIMLNQTFFEYYKQEHPDIDFSSLYNVSSENSYQDIVHVFKKFKQDDITLDESAFYIANLTFSHYIMWQDMRNRKEALRKNLIVQSIIENRNMLNTKISEGEIEEHFIDFAAPLNYDSTQLKAILECGEGKSFILDGPPGTGKSQTIVNMIVNAFYHGKTVLFVAEKKAALDVVANRLKKLGDSNSDNNLGRFCLELHSNKASKSEFFSKLGNSMELGQTKEVEKYDNLCKELEEKKNHLSKIINKLHQEKYFYSLYDAIVKREELKEHSFVVNFDRDYLLNLNEEKKEKIGKLFERYIGNANNVNQFNTNTLKAFEYDGLNFFDKATLINDFKEVKDYLEEFLDQYKQLLENFDINFPLNHHNISSIMELLNISFNKKIYLNTLNKFIEIEDDMIANEVFAHTEIVNNMMDKYKDDIYFEKLHKVNAKAILDVLNKEKNFFKRFFNNFKFKKILKDVFKTDNKIKNSQLKELFEDILLFNSSYEKMKEYNEVISLLIGEDYLKVHQNLEEIKDVYFSSRTFINLIFNLQMMKKEDNRKAYSLFTRLYTSQDPSIKLDFSVLSTKYKGYRLKETALKDKYKINAKTLSSFENDLDAYLDLLTKAVNEETFNDFLDVSALNKLRSEFDEFGLKDILEGFLNNKIIYEDFLDVFELSLAEGYIRLYFLDEEINDFNPSSFASEIKKYKDLIDEYNSLVVAVVTARLSQKLNHNAVQYAASSKVGKLKKIIAKSGRGISIRDTLVQYNDLIKDYFPCFLMSPLSAAQYLSVAEENDLSKFDIVIFDEASQIPTHEAIGPIARGNSLIVAGDPEQMPPSAYFNAGIEIDESQIELVDTNSLLDECIAIELPRIRLAYHYRSKHESLISFSNHYFYNDNLFTFPSPSTESTCIEFKHVELKEAKKSSAISKEEIEAICNQFRAIYENPQTKDKSVGLIVFNMSQQEKVQDAINSLLSKNPSLAKTVEEAEVKTKEPVFVKSLENVQGDERDFIILSIGFRKNAAGRASILGPIARDNGQRRLNVAITRSKERMFVISTIKSTDFDDDANIKNKGHLLLKRFLRFAESQTYKGRIASEYEKTSISKFIKQDLEKLGYKVDANVGNSEFKVDLAIKNKYGANYDLGILIDSRGIGDQISLRDKLYVQDSVLNLLKWKIVNIYSLEYFKNPVATIDKIVNSISEPYIEEVHEINTVIEKKEVEKFQYNSIKYQKYKCKKDTITYTNEEGYSGNIEDIIREIIEIESPVSFETIKMRIRDCSNINSMSQKAKNRLNEILDNMNLSYTIDQDQKMYWKDDNHQITHFRTHSERDISDIAKEEIECAMKQILSIQGEIVNGDLFKLVLEAFNYGQAVLNKKNQLRLEYVLNNRED